MQTFLTDTRAAATAIAAAIMTLMSLGGFALASDHVWLVYQRDLLKAAADAGGLAAGVQLTQQNATDAELYATAQRYVLANLPARLRDTAEDTMTLALTVDRGAQTVAVAASADLGGALFGAWLYDSSSVGEIHVESGNAQELSHVELVLAIDATRSMRDPYGGGSSTTRMAMVKQAAEDLLDTLTVAGQSPVAVGLVPWTTTVRLNQAARTRFVNQGWAAYPTSRYYPQPERGSTGETQTVPAQGNMTWRGCLDQRAGDAGLLPTLPADAPFTMAFYSARISQANTDDIAVSYACRNPAMQNYCYDTTTPGNKPVRLDAQGDCRSSVSSVRPLTTNVNAVRQAIQNLAPSGNATYSIAGLAWAVRLLDPAWRPVWGNSVYPTDPADGGLPVQKVLVLLTDGENNHLADLPTSEAQQQQVCTAAKQAGVTVFTIAALNPSGPNFSRLARALSDCATSADHAFVNNVTVDDLEEAFEEIGRRVRVLRRTG